MDWSRRDFIRASAVGLVLGALPPRRLRALTALRDFRPLRRNVGMFSGRGGTMGWLVNGDGVAVVDSQFPDTARTFLDGLEGREGRPVDLLLNTHHHGDHTGGNPTFREETRRIVSHVRARELQAAAGGDASEEGLADETFQDSWSAEVGDERIHARHYGPAHTGGDATVHFERANVVHMGDLVFNRLVPFIDRAGGASTRGWVTLLNRVVRDHDADTIFILGHGHPDHGVIGSRDELVVQRDFLEALLEAAGRALREGTSREELVRTERLTGFPDHRPPSERLTLGLALGTVYDELAEVG
jgi:cyclase